MKNSVSDARRRQYAKSLRSSVSALYRVWCRIAVRASQMFSDAIQAVHRLRELGRAFHERAYDVSRQLVDGVPPPERTRSSAPPMRGRGAVRAIR